MKNKLNLTDNEKRDIIKYLDSGKPLPEKYRFLLFDAEREVELLWNGKTDEVENTVLPFQAIEHIDEPRSESKINLQSSLFDTSGRQIKGWTNKLIWGDNKLILSSLKNGPLRKQIEAEGGLKLIYIDPPFDVGADFSMNIEIGEESFTKKPSVIEEIAYRDTWGKGADSFIAMVYERLKLMHGLLANNGSIFIHIDWRVVSYVRLICDEIFGNDNFVNEIIWHYADNFQGNVKGFAINHNTILWYSKSKNYIFSKVMIPLGAAVKRDKRIWSSELGKLVSARDEKGNLIYQEFTEKKADDVWEIGQSSTTKSSSKEFIGYPTQKPEKLLERIIKASSNEGDLVADFFCGSGTTLAVAEKLGRKWIGTDLGKFSIHTTRKRMIGVQRELKKNSKDFRAFEILNIGKYERAKFISDNENLREEEKRQVKQRKDNEFIKLILSAYKAEPVDSIPGFQGKKRDRLVIVGPIDLPVTSSTVEYAIEWCKKGGFTKVDILGFDYEMGIDFSEGKKHGIDIQFKVIPREVFDKKAVEKGQVKFYDVAYIEVKPIIRGRGKVKEVAIELTDFSVFYNQDNSSEVEEKLQSGGSKVILENGQLIKISKDKKTDIISKEVLTNKWADWIDYWSVDFNFESKKEIIRLVDEKTGEEKEEWTGSYIFENEWQSFRTKKDRKLEFTSAFKEVPAGKMKIAIKVIDIFGNDTTKVIEVNI
ncbi:MAG: site-specific DNA-methyltransferase [Nanoarchaeota archaeon]|nr:site-specific DNA-methyltransferase [Nanoarchaeota archaeon]